MQALYLRGKRMERGGAGPCNASDDGEQTGKQAGGLPVVNQPGDELQLFQALVGR